MILFGNSGLSSFTTGFDAVGSSAGNGYVARWANSAEPDATVPAAALVIQLQFTAIPEPGSSALAMALGSVAFAVSRRRRRA